MTNNRGFWRMGIVALVALVAVSAAVLLLRRSDPRKPDQPSASPASAPATAPTTVPTTPPLAKAVPRTYMDVVLAAHPDFPTTQPLALPLNLPEAARLILPDPIYLDPIGQLWVTRADADPLSSVLKRANKEQAHVVRERVMFVHRWPDERGVWQPRVVVPRDGGSFELISIAGRQELGSGHEYDWSRAFSWNDVFVVPTTGGVSIFRPDRRPMEVHHRFVVADGAESLNNTQILLDWRGLLAWMPWENGKQGSDGAVRFVDDQWVVLDSKHGWPRRLLHLVPLLDGGVLQLVVHDDDKVSVQLALLDPPVVKDDKIIAWIQQLSDPDPDKRSAAFRELTRYGPGIWGVLEKHKDQQSPEAQIRIEQLLSAKLKPTIGGMGLLPGKVKVVARSRGGAAMLYADQGVVVPTQDDFDLVAPAWLALIPGRSITLASADMVADLDPDRARIDILNGEFIVSDDVQGPRWWLANHYSQPLLKKSELDFSHIVGQDARGRWMFRKDAASAAPTLVVDPTLPNPTPRLPAWRFPVNGGIVGWTSDGWPAMKSGGGWVLGESDWRPLDDKTESLITELETPATAPDGPPPILVEPDGTRWYDGRESLRVQKPDGTSVIWRLPQEAVGTGIVWLVRAGDNRLFLMNEPGRLLRFKPAPNAEEPLTLEATFTRKIPNTDDIQRIWVDPASRIVIAHDIDTLTILFPSGIIPPQIARKIPAGELTEED